MMATIVEREKILEYTETIVPSPGLLSAAAAVMIVNHFPLYGSRWLLEEQLPFQFSP